MSDTSPRDQAQLRHDAGRPAKRVAQPGELLFEFLSGHNRIRCELRDHGEVYGVEAQFFTNEEFIKGRRFDRRTDPTREPREMAIAWALEERRAIERDAVNEHMGGSSDENFVSSMNREKS